MSVEYFDVEGVPVTAEDPPSKGLGATSWDVDGGRWFSISSLGRNGVRVSKDEFDKLVVEARAARARFEARNQAAS